MLDLVAENSNHQASDELTLKERLRQAESLFKFNQTLATLSTCRKSTGVPCA
jgi:hypothetical protein